MSKSRGTYKKKSYDENEPIPRRAKRFHKALEKIRQNNSETNNLFMDKEHNLDSRIFMNF
jgi:hypothetical protein